MSPKQKKVVSGVNATAENHEARHSTSGVNNERGHPFEAASIPTFCLLEIYCCISKASTSARSSSTSAISWSAGYTLDRREVPPVLC